MAIVNRSLDPSEQRKVFEAAYGAVATGVTVFVCAVPFNSTLDGIRVAAAGLSGSPTYAMTVQRFITGAGLTAITGGATTLTAVAFGTSGIQSMVMAASGSTLLNLLAGDVIALTSGAANTAVTNLSVSAVIKAVQDIKTSFGI